MKTTVSLPFNFRYNGCHLSNLNGYTFGPGDTPFAIGIVWRTFTEYYKSLETVEMAIKGRLNFIQFLCLINVNFLDNQKNINLSVKKIKH